MVLLLSTCFAWKVNGWPNRPYQYITKREEPIFSRSLILCWRESTSAALTQKKSAFSNKLQRPIVSTWLRILSFIVITDTYIDTNICLVLFPFCVLLLLLLLFEMFFVAIFVLCVCYWLCVATTHCYTHTPPHARHTSTHYFGRRSIIIVFFVLVVVFQPNNLSLLDIYYY